jgi:hypothetical protein
MEIKHNTYWSKIYYVYGGPKPVQISKRWKYITYIQQTKTLNVIIKTRGAKSDIRLHRVMIEIVLARTENVCILYIIYIILCDFVFDTDIYNKINCIQTTHTQVPWDSETNINVSIGRLNSYIKLQIQILQQLDWQNAFKNVQISR